jgi:hypothetical protein
MKKVLVFLIAGSALSGVAAYTAVAYPKAPVATAVAPVR